MLFRLKIFEKCNKNWETDFFMAIKPNIRKPDSLVKDPLKKKFAKSTLLVARLRRVTTIKRPPGLNNIYQPKEITAPHTPKLPPAQPLHT